MFPTLDHPPRNILMGRGSQRSMGMMCDGQFPQLWHPDPSPITPRVTDHIGSIPSMGISKVSPLGRHTSDGLGGYVMRKATFTLVAL